MSARRSQRVANRSSSSLPLRDYTEETDEDSAGESSSKPMSTSKEKRPELESHARVSKRYQDTPQPRQTRGQAHREALLQTAHQQRNYDRNEINPNPGTAPTTTIHGTAFNFNNMDGTLRRLKAAINSTFDQCMYTIHMPAVGVALRSPQFEPMRDNVDHSLRNLQDYVGEVHIAVRMLVGGRIAMTRLLETTPYDPRIPTSGLSIDPRIPDIVLLLRPRLRFMQHVVTILPTKGIELLESRLLRPLPTYADKINSVREKLGKLDDAIKTLDREIARLRWMLQNPPPPNRSWRQESSVGRA